VPLFLHPKAQALASTPPPTGEQKAGQADKPRGAKLDSLIRFLDLLRVRIWTGLNDPDIIAEDVNTRQGGILTKPLVRIGEVMTLSEGRHALQRYTFDYLRRDGSWQELSREVYRRGDSVVALLYCPSKGTIVLTRQFRLPVFLNDPGTGPLVEAPAGLIDREGPSTAIRRETMEETGIRIEYVQEVFVAYMSPQLITERVHFFLAEYKPDDWTSSGGGLADEGEDIEAFELSFEEALALLEKGKIQDGKTIILLLYAKANGLFSTKVNSAVNMEEGSRKEK
jgi:nudix-type nucleoside diphosphatase (YffH/AdpP family)